MLKTLIKKKEYKEFYLYLSKYNWGNYKKIYPLYKSNNTFENYYNFQDYKFIKNIVGKKRVMSIGLDPLVAVANDIFVIDGYHNLYPLSYKNKFREIIEKELKYNHEFRDYFNNWGSRVYVFYNNQDKLNINFDKAKNIGASFVISRFIINSNSLKELCKKCNGNSKLNLYRIL